MELTFKAKNEDGIMTDYEIIAVFKSEDKKKEYICYTDESLKKVNAHIYISRYEKIDNNIKLITIDNADEWQWVISNFKKINEE